MKLHWFHVCGMYPHQNGSGLGLFGMIDMPVAFKSRKLSNQNVKDIRECLQSRAGVPSVSIIDISYLGRMTHAEFNGKEAE